MLQIPRRECRYPCLVWCGGEKTGPACFRISRRWHDSHQAGSRKPIASPPARSQRERTSIGAMNAASLRGSDSSFFFSAALITIATRASTLHITDGAESLPKTLDAPRILELPPRARSTRLTGKRRSVLPLLISLVLLRLDGSAELQRGHPVRGPFVFAAPLISTSPVNASKPI